MSVISRFRVTEIALLGYATRVKMSAQFSPEGTESDETMAEIRSFHEATPNGTFEACIKNDVAAEQFQVGDQFYLNLEKVPADG